MWGTNENCIKLKRLLDQNKDEFYRELSHPGLGSHFLYSCFTSLYGKPYLEFLIRETPKHFLEKLIKRDAYAQLDSKDQPSFANTNFFQTASWLEFVLGRQFEFYKEEKEALIRLFSESYPEMWLKQALQGGSIPLLYRFSKEELNLFFQAYPYLYQQYLNWENEPNSSFDVFLRQNSDGLIQSGEGIEAALLIKDKHLLYQIRERLGSEGFERDIRRLCLKYPTLEQELFEIETGLSQEPQSFDALNFSIQSLLLQNAEVLPYSRAGTEAILLTKDQQLLNLSIQKVGVEKFNIEVQYLGIERPNLQQELLEMLARAQEHDQEIENTAIDPEVILRAWTFRYLLSQRMNPLNLNIYPTIAQLFFKELFDSNPEIIGECLSTLNLWGSLIWDSGAKSLLRQLLEKTPDLVLQNLRSITTKREIEYTACLGFGLVTLYQIDIIVGNALQDPRRHNRGDSLLDSTIKRYPPEESANLLRLFEECIPDLWMRLVFRHGYKLPLPMAEIQTGEEMSFEKRLEHAIIMKSVDLLKELCQEMKDGPFKLAMKRLRNKHPAYSAEILELEKQASPHFGLSFHNFADIGLVFQA